MKIFILQFVHEYEDGTGETTILGVYETLDEARHVARSEGVGDPRMAGRFEVHETLVGRTIGWVGSGIDKIYVVRKQDES